MLCVACILLPALRLLHATPHLPSLPPPRSDAEEEVYDAPPEDIDGGFINTGPILPPRPGPRPAAAAPPPIRDQPLPLPLRDRDRDRDHPPMPQGLSPPPLPGSRGSSSSPSMPRKAVRRSDYEGMDLTRPPKERLRSLPVSCLFFSRRSYIIQKIQK